MKHIFPTGICSVSHQVCDNIVIILSLIALVSVYIAHTVPNYTNNLMINNHIPPHPPCFRKPPVNEQVGIPTSSSSSSFFFSCRSASSGTRSVMCICSSGRHSTGGICNSCFCCCGCCCSSCCNKVRKFS